MHPQRADIDSMLLSGHTQHEVMLKYPGISQSNVSVHYNRHILAVMRQNIFAKIDDIQNMITKLVVIPESDYPLLALCNDHLRVLISPNDYKKLKNNNIILKEAK